MSRPNLGQQLVDKTGYEQGDSHGRKLIIPADPQKGCADLRALELLYAECAKMSSSFEISKGQGDPICNRGDNLRAEIQTKIHIMITNNVNNLLGKTAYFCERL